jgi:hypothetical protein
MRQSDVAILSPHPISDVSPRSLVRLQGPTKPNRDCRTSYFACKSLDIQSRCPRIPFANHKAVRYCDDVYIVLGVACTFHNRERLLSSPECIRSGNAVGNMHESDI